MFSDGVSEPGPENWRYVYVLRNVNNRLKRLMTDSNWTELFESTDFRKWGYKTSPYRVIVHKSPNGHFAALFTSAYGVDSHLIRGNCGAGTVGSAKATAAAREFMEDHKFGCPPPGEMNGAIA